MGRGYVSALQGTIEDRLRFQMLIRLISFEKKVPGFVVCDLLQHLLANWIFQIVEHRVRIVGEPSRMKAYEIAHQADVYKIDRLCQPFAQCEEPSIFFFFEICEDVSTSTCEKYFPRIAGILPIQSLIEQLRKRQAVIRAHCFCSPARNRIVR